VEAETDGLDLSGVTDPKHKQTIKERVQNYEPRKSREVGVKMSLILQDDIPVCERPRRLSPHEKIE
ncbi:hypothetical protein K0M31_016004, partial [Melipona bicolor]